nr:autotransporter outer membrane beta-barrel domain-containing protein [Phyllobacterium sp. CL33Tsu]
MLTIQASGSLTDFGGFVGSLPGGQGIVTVTGTGSVWTNTGTVVVGGQGAGTLIIQDGGTVTSGGGGSVGLSAGSSGTVMVTGAGSRWINAPGGGLNVGSFGKGLLTIENGGMVINNTNFAANIGNGAGATGLVTVTGAGSTWSNSVGMNVGGSGTGTLTITDGGIVSAGPTAIAANAGSVGTLNIGGGTGSPAAAPGALTVPSVTFGAGIGTLNFNHTSANYVFAPAVSGSGTVNVLAGTATLTSANSYSGATNVNAGTLRAGGLNTFSPNSAMMIASGGTLDLNGFSQTVPRVTNGGLVTMGTSTGPGTVLTTASYIGRGGTISLNTFLGTDGSPSDRLLIDGGPATGTTRMSFTDTGGGGALTTGDGILVVDAQNGGRTAPRAFAGFAAAGPFDYLLFRGGSTPGSENDLFLRSNLQPIPPEPSSPGAEPDPNPEPPSPPGRPVPRYRPEVSLYAAMPVLASIYGRHIIGTLHERMGGDAQLLGPGKQDVPDGMWGRIIGYWGHRDGDPIGIYGRSGPAFDYDFGAVQTGLDLYRNEYANGQRDNAGLYVAVGRANADVEHNLLGRTFKGGEDKFNAVTVGGYWTRFGESDWYVDGVLQGTWYDMDMTASRGLRDGDTNGFGLAASLEGGYPFHLGNDWLLEPQAQLVYQALNIDDFNDGAADVSYSDTDSLAGRLGARVARDWHIGAADASGRAARRFSLWVRGDIWHEFLDEPTTEFSSATGAIPFTADLGETSGRLGIGAAMQVTNATTVYGNVNYESSFEGDADAWAGKVGFKTTW